MIPFKFNECDLKDGLDYRNIDPVKYDVVIHLAAIVGDQACDARPMEAWMTNTIGLMEFAYKCVRDGVKQFIFISTCSIYTGHPTIYSESKKLAERVLGNLPGLNASILRLGTVYGQSPEMRYNLVVNLFKKLSHEGAITVFGGEQERPFVHIDDVCHAILGLLDNPRPLTHVVGENMTIEKLARLVSTVSGCKLNFDPHATDLRSYHVESDIETQHTIEEYLHE